MLITRENSKRVFSKSSPSGREGKKKLKSIGDNNYHDPNWKPWEELLGDLLDSISNRLNLVDYSSFGGVCRRWRSLAVEYKKDYVASQPPLLFMATRVDKRSCHFYNIFDDVHATYKKMLPHYADSIYCYAVSCGYLVAYIFSRPQLWLLNPITRQEYIFPCPPHALNRLIIASQGGPWASSPHHIVIVGVGICHSNVLFYQSGDANWTVRSHCKGDGEIVDVATFKGKVYYLTRTAGIGTINLTTSHDHLILVPLEVIKGSPPPPIASAGGYYLELVTSDEQILMVVFLKLKVVSVYALDLKKMEWCRVEKSLGNDQALFTSNLNSLNQSSALVKNPARWGGRSNCIYHFDLEASCLVYSLDGNLLQSYPAPLKTPLRTQPLWYFPHQAYNSIDSLYEGGQD